MLIFEINLTTSCSLRCAYCYEGKWFEKNQIISNEIIRNIYKFINSLKKEKWFNRVSPQFKGREYSGIELRFWGGEPTLEPLIIKEFIDRFKNDQLVSFFLYTNGVDFEKIKSLLIETNKYETFYEVPKFFVQVSYDGNPIHDQHRIFSRQKGSSEKVLKSIQWLYDNKIPFNLKSTLPLQGISSLFSSYMDVKNLIKKYNLNTKYFPSFDYFSDNLLSEEEIVKLKSELNVQLDLILDEEIREFRENQRYFFKWFEEYKPFCSSGRNIFSINLNGDLLKCHGCFYSDQYEDFLLGNVSEENSIKNLKRSIDFHKNIWNDIPLECVNCEVDFCLKCNVKSFELSKKKLYSEKWIDYGCQNHLCELYREIYQAKLRFERKKRNYLT